MKRLQRPRTSSGRGLTIIELLCALAIMAVLIGMIAPAVARARESARRIECSSRLKEIGLALHGFESSEGALPAGWALESTRRSAYGWLAALLPWLEQRPACETLRLRAPLDDARVDGVRRLVLPIAQCPSDPVAAEFPLFREESLEHEGFGQESETVLIELPSASYVGIFGNHDPDESDGVPGEGAFLENRRVRLSEMERGLSQTMFVSERTARKLPSTWIGFLVEGEDAAARVTAFADLGPNRSDSDECELDSRHPGLIQVLWGDGRVEPVADGIDAAVYRMMARRRSP